ncbi:hydantoinase B/oxoprolinase family protein [Chloroflexi bacterium TSY]|nr:hydantoinase B/oxoprolinase family protein [Chloroflexi bacterium TSY]
MIAQAEFCPAPLGAILFTVKWAIAEIGLENFEPGDVIIHNDPYRGGCRAHSPSSWPSACLKLTFGNESPHVQPRSLGCRAKWEYSHLVPALTWPCCAGTPILYPCVIYPKPSGPAAAGNRW